MSIRFCFSICSFSYENYWGSQLLPQVFLILSSLFPSWNFYTPRCPASFCPAWAAPPEASAANAHPHGNWPLFSPERLVWATVSMALWPCPPRGHQHLMELLSSPHLQLPLASPGLGEACSLFSEVDMRHCCMETVLQLDLLIKAGVYCAKWLSAVSKVLNLPPGCPCLFHFCSLHVSVSAPLSLPNLPVSPFVSLFALLSDLLPPVSIPLSLQGTGIIAITLTFQTPDPASYVGLKPLNLLPHLI